MLVSEMAYSTWLSPTSAPSISRGSQSRLRNRRAVKYQSTRVPHSSISRWFSSQHRNYITKPKQTQCLISTHEPVVQDWRLAHPNDGGFMTTRATVQPRDPGPAPPTILINARQDRLLVVDRTPQLEVEMGRTTNTTIIVEAALRVLIRRGPRATLLQHRLQHTNL